MTDWRSLCLVLNTPQSVHRLVSQGGGSAVLWCRSGQSVLVRHYAKCMSLSAQHVRAFACVDPLQCTVYMCVCVSVVGCIHALLHEYEVGSVPHVAPPSLSVPTCLELCSVFIYTLLVQKYCLTRPLHDNIHELFVNMLSAGWLSTNHVLTCNGSRKRVSFAGEYSLERFLNCIIVIFERYVYSWLRSSCDTFLSPVICHCDWNVQFIFMLLDDDKAAIPLAAHAHVSTVICLYSV